MLWVYRVLARLPPLLFRRNDQLLTINFCCSQNSKTSTDGLTARLLRRNEVMRVQLRLGALG